MFNIFNKLRLKWLKRNLVKLESNLYECRAKQKRTKGKIEDLEQNLMFYDNEKNVENRQGIEKKINVYKRFLGLLIEEDDKIVDKIKLIEKRIEDIQVDMVQAILDKQQ